MGRFFLGDVVEGELVYSLPPRLKKINNVANHNGVVIQVFDFYKECMGFEDEEAVAKLSNCYDLEDDVLSTKGWFDGRSGWRQHKEIPEDTISTNSDIRKYEFKNKDGFITSIVEANFEEKTLLPITAWTKNGT